MASTQQDADSKDYEQEYVGVSDFFNSTGGYGFIRCDDVDDDVFYHMEDVGGSDVEEGEKVVFDVEFADKGPRAINLERIEDED